MRSTNAKMPEVLEQLTYRQKKPQTNRKPKPKPNAFHHSLEKSWEIIKKPEVGLDDHINAFNVFSTQTETRSP